MNRGTLALIAAAVVAAGPARAGLEVVATTPDYAALARAVGGDGVAVKALAKPTEDPHFVDAKPSHLVTLRSADLLVESGAELEVGWLPPLVENARNKKILPGAAGHVFGSDGVALLDVPAVLDRSQGDVHARGNPHFLMDPGNAAIVARRLAERFCQLDAASCPAYRGNLARFEGDLEARMKIWSAKLAPYAGTAIVTYHNTWKYFAGRFGLRAETFLEPKPGIPPSPPHLAGVIQSMREGGMKVILVEPFQSRKTAESVAERTGATVVGVCQFPGGLPGTDGDYLALMDANIDAVAAALASAGGSP